MLLFRMAQLVVASCCGNPASRRPQEASALRPHGNPEAERAARAAARGNEMGTRAPEARYCYPKAPGNPEARGLRAALMLFTTSRARGSHRRGFLTNLAASACQDFVLDAALGF